LPNKIVKIAVVLTFLVLAGCDQSPLDKLLDPTGEGALGGGWGPWKIYDDQLNTGGGVMLCPTNEHQTFSEVTENPHSGTKCIKYSWDGQWVQGKNWTAAVLIVAPTWREYDEGEKNLTLGNYNRITFWIRGNLSSGAKIRFEGPGPYGSCPSTENFDALPESWTMKRIDLTGSDLSQVKEFFKIVFDGGGGTVYVDNITYTRE
jgi:hypothetical protein